MERFVSDFMSNVLSVYQTDPLLVIGTMLFSVLWFGLLGFLSDCRPHRTSCASQSWRWRAIPGIHHEKSRAYRVLPDRSAFKLDALCLALALVGLAVGWWLTPRMPTAEPVLKLGTAGRFEPARVSASAPANTALPAEPPATDTLRIGPRGDSPARAAGPEPGGFAANGAGLAARRCSECRRPRIGSQRGGRRVYGGAGAGAMWL